MTVSVPSASVAKAVTPTTVPIVEFSSTKSAALSASLIAETLPAGVCPLVFLDSSDPTVAAVLPNIPEMLECHYGVPMAGAVLNTINTRLDAATIAYILDHGEAKALIVDREFIPAVRLALVQAAVKPLIIEVDDPLAPDSSRTETLGGMTYDTLLAEGDAGQIRRGFGGGNGHASCQQKDQGENEINGLAGHGGLLGAAGAVCWLGGLWTSAFCRGGSYHVRLVGRFPGI